jgi:membrane-associated phospholipid phosphatase
MNPSTEQPSPVVVPHIPSETPRRTRRPSGEPPPLPRHLQTSGIGWLVAAAALVAAAGAVFSRGLRGAAVDVSIVDHSVIAWLQDIRAPGSVGASQALAWLSSWTFLDVVGPALLVTLLVLRRFRHLVVALLVITALQVVAGIMLARWMHRPRPLGVAHRAAWGGWAMPSLQMTLLSAGFVAILYSLVPAGRWRNLGKWVTTAVLALVGLSRVALGVDAPSDVLVGVALGVTVPLLAFRWFTPDEVFPVT